MNLLAKMNLTINDDLDKRFRNKINAVLGFKKGNIQKAVEEAFEDWILKHGGPVIIL